MKRFMLFSGSDYYPAGGMDDFSDSFDTLELAMSHRESKNDEYYIEWKHIFDIKENKIVKEWYGEEWGNPQEF